MKWTLLFFAFAISLGTFAQELELRTGQSTVLIGEAVEIKLSIKGVKPQTLRGIDASFVYSDRKLPFFGASSPQQQFVYRFHIVPQEEGPLKVGPFTIGFEGKELTSDSLFLEVVAPDSAARLITIDAPIKAKRGEVFKLTCKSSSIALHSLELKEQKGVTMKSSSINSSISFNSGERVEHYSKVFNLVMKSKGEFSFDDDSFIGLEDVHFAPVVIRVK